MITVIINPIAGGARPGSAPQRAALASAVLTSCGETAEVCVAERKGHARELASRAVGRGARLVIAWGGDGTLNEVGSALAFGQTPLALVPSGSGNGLARELGVARQPDRAIGEAVRAVPRAIDVGELGGRLFFNIAGVGFDAHVAACLDRDHHRRGFAGYARIVARELWAYQSARYRIDHDGVARRAILVTLANSPQFGNGARIAPAARLDDGRLDLVVVGEASRFATVCSAPRLFVGGLTRLRHVSTRQVEQVTIASDAPMAFHVDGEPAQGGTELDARVHPGALRVCVR
jgi:YegS/Rv2252/BmrU family lipid kinase